MTEQPLQKLANATIVHLNNNANCLEAEGRGWFGGCGLMVEC